MKPTILIIGAGGQLGKALTRTFADYGTVVEAARRPAAPHQIPVDLSDAASIDHALALAEPDWILIAAAYCNVDGAESDPDRCYAVNAEGPARIAAFAARRGAAAVYYSTDHIFDGSLPLYHEDDPACPLNVYSASKAAGEDAVRETLPDNHLILRTASVYGFDDQKKNFVLRVVDELSKGNALRVPSDQWGSPTFVGDLAAATRFLLESDFRGTVHAVGDEYLSRVEFAQRICRVFALNEELIRPVPTEALAQPARRARGVRLSRERLADLGFDGFRSIDHGLRAMKAWHESIAHSVAT